MKRGARGPSPTSLGVEYGDEIAEEVEEGGDGELAERIREHEVYVNFSDSWFNLDALDVRNLEKIGRMTREQIVKAVVEELRK